jgi:CheY-like chemotaxis protein
MTLDDFIRLIEALTKLLGVLVWPLLVLYVLLRFSVPLREFVESLGEFSLKAVGVEATAKRISNAQAALAAAAAKNSKTPEAVATEVQEAASLVAASVNAATIRRNAGSVVLWVDDHPLNNTYERQSLSALGVSFHEARSTDEALELLKRQNFDLVISDMSRPPDHSAGYTLLDAIRNLGKRVPVIIYSSSDDPNHDAEARRRGAFATAHRASRLFAYVNEALRSAS